MVMRSLYAGDALEPPLWKIPNKALSLFLSGSLPLSQERRGRQGHHDHHDMIDSGYPGLPRADAAVTVTVTPPPSLFWGMLCVSFFYVIETGATGSRGP